MKIDKEELQTLIEKIASFSDPAKPFTRKAFSTYYKDCRTYIKNYFQDCGLNVIYDDFANILAIKKGMSNNCILVGSHSDTVYGGGKFDGVLGVVAAMLIAKKLKDVKLKNTVIFIDYFAEESNDYGLYCLGSMGLAGRLSKEQLLLELNNETLAKKIIKSGGNEKFRSFKELNIANAIASFELHIEQGASLESMNKNLGVVSSILGISMFNIEFYGTSNHAGTTPMNLRKDALLNAAKFITWVNELAIKANEEDYTVATVSKCEVKNTSSNVISDYAKISLDLRCQSDELRFKLVDKIINYAKTLNAEVNLIASSNSIKASDELMNIITKSAKKLNANYMQMPSGAGHDSMFVADFCKMGMIFVPSVNGISHNKEEFSSYDDCELGANVLLESILSFDNAN